MPDTGAPFNIPFLDGTELVRAYPDFSEDLADAVADGLSAAGGLVAVKSAIFTGIQTASVTAGNNVAVTDLTITHEVADPANKLIISAFIGAASNAVAQVGNVGIAVHDGTGLIGVGNADGSRTQLSAGGRLSASPSALAVSNPSITFVHAPGAGSKTYTLRAINIRTGTSTIHINRSESDVNNADSPRSISSLVIQEVKV